MLGRVGMLKLSGPEGNLDIFVCYLDSRDPQNRKTAVSQIAAHAQLPDVSLSLLFGDFNLVEKADDRISKSTGLESGSRNRAEAEHFQNVLLHPFQFVEWQQPDFTCEIECSFSRLDRFYTNMAPCEKQNRHVECIPLSWQRGLSAHRPIHFARTKKPPKTGTRPLPAWVLEHPDFFL